jgi:hypothetical protein
LKPIYYDRIKDGILNPVTNMEVVREGPTTAVIDGHNGMGHVISFGHGKWAIDKARQYWAWAWWQYETPATTVLLVIIHLWPLTRE